MKRKEYLYSESNYYWRSNSIRPVQGTCYHRREFFNLPKFWPGIIEKKNWEKKKKLVLELKLNLRVKAASL